MIRARELCKRYGDKRVLERLDLDVERGGFLVVTGPNGAGKTTLLRLCAGLRGSDRAATLEVEAPRAAVGFLSHEPLVYRELTPLENLELYGRLYRIPERRERIGMLLERFGLWDERRSAGSRLLAWDDAATRALPDAAARAGARSCSTSPLPGLDAEGAALVDRELRELARHLHRRCSPPTAPSGSSRSRARGWRSPPA